MECLRKGGCDKLTDPAPCGVELEMSEFAYTVHGEEVRAQTCPANLVDQRGGTWLVLYGSWKEGVLWAAGGLRDQPALYVRAMMVLDSAVNEITKEKQEEQEKKQARKQQTPARRR